MPRIARLSPAVSFCGVVSASLVLLSVCSQPASARGGPPRTVSPLPPSDYSVRPACPAPAPGHASCLALELVPQTPAARAHARPLGMARRIPSAASGAAAVCELPRTAAKGCYGLRPQDLRGAYGLPTTAPVAQTIALVEAYSDPSAEADLKVYDQEFHLPECTAANGCLSEVNESGRVAPLPAPNGGWAEESSLDLQIAHAACQNCHLLLVEARNESYASLEAAETAAAELGATEISNSWSGPEPIADSPAFDRPGIAITAASGDDGYLNWAGTGEEKGEVGYPASSPHVVAVGGTRLSLTAEGVWAGETVWNGKGATGGGCSERFEAAPWQRSLAAWAAVGCASSRAVADVSADADPYTGVAVYDSTPAPVEGNPLETRVPGWISLGGTSLATPLISATFALAGGVASGRYAAQTLYEHERSLPGSLHDVEVGSNGQCSIFSVVTGLSGCTALQAAAGCSGQAICLAGPGYDGPSGVGTPSGIGAFHPPAPQTIRFDSAAPGSATVGGPSYGVSASASSGLAVSLSSASPSVCTMVGTSVIFTGAGTCAIDADQAGDSDYLAAPRAQQSFAVGSPPARISQIPKGRFRLLGIPSINARTGAITFVVSVDDPGTLNWLLTFPNGQLGAFVATRGTCSPGRIRLAGKCRPARIVFGSGTATAYAAGVRIRFTVVPSPSARIALENGLRKRRNLPITARISFQSSRGAADFSNARLIAVKLTAPSRRGARSAAHEPVASAFARASAERPLRRTGSPWETSTRSIRNSPGTISAGSTS